MFKQSKNSLVYRGSGKKSAPRKMKGRKDLNGASAHVYHQKEPVAVKVAVKDIQL